MDITYIKGIGPKKAELFNKLEIATVTDLLHYYPRTYSDRRPTNMSKFGAVSQVVFLGRVARTQYIPAKAILIFKAFLEDDNGQTLECTWFKKRTFYASRFDPVMQLKKDFALGKWFWVVGKREDKESFISNKITVDEYYSAEDPVAAWHVNRLTPMYRLTEGLNNKMFRNAVALALENNLAEEPDILPENLIKKRALLSARQALKAIHFPANTAELSSAERRLIYEEFLLLAAAWGIKKRQNIINKKYTYNVTRLLLTPFRDRLGFDFTKSQIKVINEIFASMMSPTPMTRLLQGDVGSGKTIVALSAMLLAVENNYQAALMAPTEILAEQHFMTVTKFLQGQGINVALLTSSTPAKERAKILNALVEGEINILLGTHSLIENNVLFKNLKLIVIDEQHRFGVEQRARLRKKAEHIDMLAMTATPIPRTLALAFYGDLDVSTITELPPGRKKITTLNLPESEAHALVLEELKKGRQAYIVYPLIEESEKLSAKAVKEDFEKLEKVFSGYNIAMLHGQMKRKDKEKVMAQFSACKVDVLVATPVIEVGIDVKNATVMMINSASRFGLASLHQLRGRVGRGSEESFCLLVPGRETSTSKERLDILCKTQDGFLIGEKDMEIRGPGEILGTRQSGEVELKAGDILKDNEILKKAAEDRDELLSADPMLTRPEHKLFRARLIDLYQRQFHLIDLS